MKPKKRNLNSKKLHTRIRLLCVLAAALIIASAANAVIALQSDDATGKEIATLRNQVRILSMEIGAVEEATAKKFEEAGGGLWEGSASSATSFTEQEIALLERVVTAEAGSEPYDGMIAVAEAALNRSEYWGMSLMEVLTYPAAFSLGYKGEISDDVKHAVADALAGIRVFRDPVTHFHEASITPYWAAAKTFAGMIGNHKFYY
jgi:spore germination cell wall hydrolase CwlJ-like protein